MQRALIVGLAGPHLTQPEAGFLRRVRPAGIILFARNVESPAQLRQLIGDVRTELAHTSPLVLVDQEGGRVQRLRPPHWRDLPAAAAYAALYETAPAAARAAAADIARLTASELRAAGFNTNCAPCADCPTSEADAIIGDRAYGDMPHQVAELARAVAGGYLAGGVLPVVKHIPGHGRATADSHLALPVVPARRATLSQTDFAVFRALADLPAAMTAHVVYGDVDARNPASVSPAVIGTIVRGEIGFDGLLMSDDLSMRALSGAIGERASAVLSAGCDVVLHCNGNLAEMIEVAACSPVLDGRARERLETCWHHISDPAPELRPEEAVRAEKALLQLGATPFPVESV